MLRCEPRSTSTSKPVHSTYPSTRIPILTARLALVLLVSAAASASAQQTMAGYSPASAAREREVEASAIKRPSADAAAAHSKQLSRETHVAGTAAQARTRDYVIEQMKKWGIDTEVRTYDVWMPHPTSVRVARVSPQPKDLRSPSRR